MRKNKYTESNVPASVIFLHQEILIWVSSGHPSDKAFNDKSVISSHESISKRWSFLQNLFKDWHVL